MAIVILNEI